MRETAPFPTHIGLSWGHYPSLVFHHHHKSFYHQYASDGGDGDDDGVHDKDAGDGCGGCGTRAD